MTGTLYLVATPIGNLEDITLRAIRILNESSIVLAEDTRNSKKLFKAHKISSKLVSYNDFSSQKKIYSIIEHLKDGKIVSLISDAGTPLVSDPGHELVSQVINEKINVESIPGPSSVISGLITSGFKNNKFIFEGFLPKNNSERKKLLAELSRNEKTTILFESPHRFKKLLFELKEFCGGDREIIINRELTKKFEEQIGNNIDQVINYFEDKEILGEITVVIKGIKKINKILSYDEDIIKKELCELTEAGMSLNMASKYLAKKYFLKKNMIYNMFKNYN